MPKPRRRIAAQPDLPTENIPGERFASAYAKRAARRKGVFYRLLTTRFSLLSAPFPYSLL